MEPTSAYYRSQRLSLHYLDWGNEQAPCLVLIHGGKDHARSWDWVARALAHDYRVIAPDLRGHGESDWATGSMYCLVDSVLDLARLVEHLAVNTVMLVGHSYGGAVALLYAGIFPERVSALVAIEGVGVPDRLGGIHHQQGPLWERIQTWIRKSSTFEERSTFGYASIEEAKAHLRSAQTFLTEEQADHLTRHGVRRDSNGRYRLKFDPLSRVVSPFPLGEETLADLKGRIECPTLLLFGAKSWAGDPMADGRTAGLRDVRSVCIEDAGHWMHHERLEPFLKELREFLSASVT